MITPGMILDQLMDGLQAELPARLTQVGALDGIDQVPAPVEWRLTSTDTARMFNQLPLVHTHIGRIELEPDGLGEGLSGLVTVTVQAVVRGHDWAHSARLAGVYGTAIASILPSLAGGPLERVYPSNIELAVATTSGARTLAEVVVDAHVGVCGLIDFYPKPVERFRTVEPLVTAKER